MLLTKGPRTLKTRDKQKEKKIQKKAPRSHGNASFLHILKGRVANEFDESASTFDIYEQIFNLDVLIDTCATKQRLFATKLEEVLPEHFF